MNNFEDVFDEKMKFGFYQKILLLVGCLVNFSAGGFLHLIPFLARYIQWENNLTFNETNLLAASGGVGAFLGDMILGYLLFTFGRKKVLTASVIIAVAPAVLFYYAENFYYTVLANLLIGFQLAISGNTITIYMVEEITGKHKGKFMVLLFASFAFGKIYAAGLVWLGSGVYEFGDWKIPLMMSSLVCIFVFPAILFISKESIKFNFHRGKLKEAQQDYHKIQKLNHRKSYLVRNEMLISYYQLQQFHQNDKQQISILENQINNFPVSKKKSNFILAIWFFISLCMSSYAQVGQVLAISNILGNENTVLLANVAIVTGELWGGLMCGVLIDNPKVGKKRLIIFSHFGMAILFGVAILTDKWGLYAVFYAAKMLASVAMMCTYIHLSESFPIDVRGKYTSLVDGFMQITLLLFGLMFYETVKWGEIWVYGFLSLISVIGFFASFCLPSDLRQLNRTKVN